MTHDLYAITRSSGPVWVGRYETRQALRNAWRDAMRRLADGGYAEDVTGFAFGATVQSGGPGRATPEAGDSCVARGKKQNAER